MHDLKAVERALAPHAVALAGVRFDVMLLSYLVNPTHSSHTLPDIAARTTSVALKHQATKENPNDKDRLSEAAAAIARLAAVLGEQVRTAAPVEHDVPKDDPTLGGAITEEMMFAGPGKAKGTAEADSSTVTAKGDEANGPLMEVYHTIDLPLVPVLLRMEQAGVRIDSGVLRDLNARLTVEIDTLAERIYADSGHRFNINSPKQLGDVLFNRMDLPKPMKYGKGKVVSTAQDVLEELAERFPIAALVIEHRQLQKLKSTYLGRLAAACGRRRPHPHNVQPGGHGDWAA